MKKFFIILGILLVIGGMGFYVWTLFSQPPQGAVNPPHPSLPFAPSVTSPNQPIPNQQAAVGTQAQIARSFTSQIQNAGSIKLYGTTVVAAYALQEWGDENKGGEALFKYDPSQGWVLLSMGGGAWSVSGLVQLFNVPQNVAEQLIAGSTN